MTDATEDGAFAPEGHLEMALSAITDLAAPQQRYLDLIAGGGFEQPMEGVALSFSRVNTLVRGVLNGGVRAASGKRFLVRSRRSRDSRIQPCTSRE